MTDISEIEALYGNPSNGETEKEHRPRHLEPVFDRAREKQFEVMELRSTTQDESVLALSTYMDTVIKELNSEVFATKLVNESAVLSGPNIVHVSANNIIQTNSFIVQPLKPEESDLPNTDSETGGLFYGFTTRYQAIEKDGETLGVRPIIAYQLKVGSYEVAHSFGSICITGDVGITQIEFADDIQRRQVSEVLAVLTDYPSSVVIEHVHEIDKTLADMSVPNAESMRRVGYLANRLINAIDPEIGQKYYDALIDLFSCYINIESSFEIVTASVLKLPRIDDRQSSPMELIHGKPLTRLVCQPEQLVVLPLYKNNNGTLETTDKQALYVAVDIANASWFIKLSDIEVFTPH